MPKVTLADKAAFAAKFAALVWQADRDSVAQSGNSYLGQRIRRMYKTYGEVETWRRLTINHSKLAAKELQKCIVEHGEARSGEAIMLSDPDFKWLFDNTILALARRNLEQAHGAIAEGSAG